MKGERKASKYWKWEGKEVINGRRKERKYGITERRKAR